MLRNYFAAAIRNLFRNRAYAAINLLGLALGFAAVILIGLFIRDEYSYDRFFPEHERIYRVAVTINPPGGVPFLLSVTASNIARAMELDFPEVENATRLSPSIVVLRNGDIQVSGFVHWADPDFFRLFPMTTLSGDLSQALDRPDGLVLTRSAARRLFGRDEVVGRPLELNRQHTMHVAAVIEDLPSNTHLNASIFGSGIASFSGLTALDAQSGDLKSDNVYSYVRLRSGARAEDLNARMRGFSERHVPGEVNGFRRSEAYSFSLVPIADVHLQPRGLGDAKPPGDPRSLQAMIAIAILILVVAASNFVSMMTARAARRAVEVGVRKAVGATRRQIIVQFLGECLFYAGLALVIAVVAVELTMPAFNAFLQRGIAFNYLRDPMLGASIIGIALLTGLAAGAYPALVLSAFRPNAVLKGIVLLPGGSGRLRQALVAFQFGTLIALIVSTMTINRQTQFALEDRLRFPADQIYFAATGCPAAFRESISGLDGVLVATCASGSALNMDRFGTVFQSQDGGNISFRTAPLDYDFLELFGIKLLAGRFFAQNHGEDDLLRANPSSVSNPSIIINETGARVLGYSDPKAAVGQHRRWIRNTLTASGYRAHESQSSEIIGVIPDFSLGSVRDSIEPTAYYISDPSVLYFTILKLNGQNVPETMREIKSLWLRQAGARPLEGRFFNQYVNDLHADIQRQATIFSAFSGVAVIIAALGLLGLAVFTAERRTREIGLRKVMGASRSDILRFIGWQFARPVLIANLVAWPVAWFFMRRWLEGFAYHVDLGPLAFLVASGLALLIALITVSGHALLVARSTPVEALRYE